MVLYSVILLNDILQSARNKLLTSDDNKLVATCYEQSVFSKSITVTNLVTSQQGDNNLFQTCHNNCSTTTLLQLVFGSVTTCAFFTCEALLLSKCSS